MKQYLVLGLGRFGQSVCETLKNHHKTVIAIDSSAELVQEAVDKGIVTDALIGDVTQDRTLKSINIESFSAVFVCIGSDIEASILATHTLRELKVEKIIAKAVTRKHGKILENVGATTVVYPEMHMGERVALQEVQPNILEQLQFGKEHILLEIESPKSFIGKDLKSLNFRNHFGGNIIGISSQQGSSNLLPMGETIIKQGDKLLIIVSKKEAKRLENLT